MTDQTAGNAEQKTSEAPPKRSLVRRAFRPVFIVLVFAGCAAGGLAAWIAFEPVPVPSYLDPRNWMQAQQQPVEQEPVSRLVTPESISAVLQVAAETSSPVPESAPDDWAPPTVTFDPDQSLAALVDGRLLPVEQRMDRLDSELRQAQQALADSFGQRVTEIRASIEPIARKVDALQARIDDIDRLDSSILGIEATIIEGTRSYKQALDDAEAHREQTRIDIRSVLHTLRLQRERITDVMLQLDGITAELHLMNNYAAAPIIGGVPAAEAPRTEPPEPAPELSAITTPKWCAGELEVGDSTERFGTVLSIQRAAEGDYVTSDRGVMFVSPCPSAEDPGADR